MKTDNSQNHQWKENAKSALDSLLPNGELATFDELEKLIKSQFKSKLCEETKVQLDEKNNELKEILVNIRQRKNSSANSLFRLIAKSARSSLSQLSKHIHDLNIQSAINHVMIECMLRFVEEFDFYAAYFVEDIEINNKLYYNQAGRVNRDTLIEALCSEVRASHANKPINHDKFAEVLYTKKASFESKEEYIIFTKELFKEKHRTSTQMHILSINFEFISEILGALFTETLSSYGYTSFFECRPPELTPGVGSLKSSYAVDIFRSSSIQDAAYKLSKHLKEVGSYFYPAIKKLKRQIKEVMLDQKNSLISELQVAKEGVYKALEKKEVNEIHELKRMETISFDKIPKDFDCFIAEKLVKMLGFVPNFNFYQAKQSKNHIPDVIEAIRDFRSFKRQNTIELLHLVSTDRIISSILSRDQSTSMFSTSEPYGQFLTQSLKSKLSSMLVTLPSWPNSPPPWLLRAISKTLCSEPFTPDPGLSLRHDPLLGPAKKENTVFLLFSVFLLLRGGDDQHRGISQTQQIAHQIAGHWLCARTLVRGFARKTWSKVSDNRFGFQRKYLELMKIQMASPNTHFEDYQDMKQKTRVDQTVSCICSASCSFLLKIVGLSHSGFSEIKEDFDGIFYPNCPIKITKEGITHIQKYEIEPISPKSNIIQRGGIVGVFFPGFTSESVPLQSYLENFMKERQEDEIIGVRWEASSLKKLTYLFINDEINTIQQQQRIHNIKGRDGILFNNHEIHDEITRCIKDRTYLEELEYLIDLAAELIFDIFTGDILWARIGAQTFLLFVKGIVHIIKEFWACYDEAIRVGVAQAYMINNLDCIDRKPLDLYGFSLGSLSAFHTATNLKSTSPGICDLYLLGSVLDKSEFLSKASVLLSPTIGTVRGKIYIDYSSSDSVLWGLSYLSWIKGKGKELPLGHFGITHHEILDALKIQGTANEKDTEAWLTYLRFKVVILNLSKEGFGHLDYQESFDYILNR